MNFHVRAPAFVMNNPMLHRAFLFAQDAHAEVKQVRKYTNEPYIVHPVAVAQIVHHHGGSTLQVGAALLHDTVEDTNATLQDIEQLFGFEMAAMVGWLTDVSVPEDGNRAVRKALDRAHSAAAPAEAQTVKVADLIHNTISIAQHDEHFAKCYFEEKWALLDVMTEADQKLKDFARKQVQEAQRQIIVNTLRRLHTKG